MGIAQIPASSGGLSSAIKSVQRGEAVAAGNITISTVDTTKTMVNSFGTTAAGTVAATGTLSGATGSTSAVSTAAFTANAGMWINNSFAPVQGGFGSIPYPAYAAPNYNVNNRYGATPGPYFVGQSYIGDTYMNAYNINGANVSLNATNLSGGSTNLVAANYGVYLVNSTTIYATGPCRYEVVEYF